MVSLQFVLHNEVQLRLSFNHDKLKFPTTSFIKKDHRYIKNILVLVCRDTNGSETITDYKTDITKVR